MNIENKKILITGGTGFIGKVLIKSLLDKKAKIICLSRKKRISKQKNLKYIKCDLRKINQKKDLVNKIGKVNLIIYLAASIPLLGQKKETLIEAKKNNLDPFLNFLSTFGNFSNKIIFTSTIDVYGIPKNKNFSEDTFIKPITNYAIAKYCCEKYLEFYCRHKNKAYVILRFSQVYGPDESLIRVMSFIIDAVVNNKIFTLWGTGQDKRKFLYVKDAASSILKAISYNKNNIFNIAGKEETSIKQAIKIVEKNFGKEIKIKRKNVDRPPINILPSINKARNKLKFSPSFNLERGIQSIINNKI